MTTATSEAISDADRYLKEVAPHLAALPAEERADLLEDLALHLQEVAAEPGPLLEERLGPPAAYAAELLATAGYGPPEPSAARVGLVAAASGLAAWLRRSALGREVVRLWPSLRPAWWVARAYLAVYLITDLERNGGDFHGFPIPHLFGNPLAGLLALALAIPASIRLGQRELTGGKRLAVRAANAVLLFYALVLAGQVAPADGRYVEYQGPARFIADECLRNGEGELITNLYAYDAEGRLLDPVLLYDQYGRPVDNLCPDFDDQGRRLITEYRRDANGAPVVNAFPRKQGASLDPFAAKRPGIPVQPEPTVPVSPPAVVVPRLSPTTTTTPVTSVP